VSPVSRADHNMWYAKQPAASVILLLRGLKYHSHRTYSLDFRYALGYRTSAQASSQRRLTSAGRRDTLKDSPNTLSGVGARSFACSG
jgi:hypothetical protein